MASAWLPQVEAYSPKDRSTFAFKSVSQRWPTIITSSIDNLYQASYALSYSSNRDLADAKIQESKDIVEKLSKLKHDMGRDKALEPIENDGGDPVDEYNAVIKKSGYTWFSAPWLFAECYLYRLVRSYFARSQHWQQYDPFSTQKVGAFRASAQALEQLSEAVIELIRKAEAGSQERKADPSQANTINEGLGVIFNELAQTSLWGNATDLSLLTHLTHADLQELQAGGIGAEAQKKRERFVLTGLGGISQAWQKLLAAPAGQRRVDIILDNSGFELFTDLLLAEFLLSAGVAEEIVFHPKDMPWFVSDVTPADLVFALEALQSEDFFTKAHQKEVSLPSRVSRSSSRSREIVADERHFEGARRDMSPAGSRMLRMEAVPENGKVDNEAYGSRTLRRTDTGEGERGRAEEAEDAALEHRGRPSQGKMNGSKTLQLDPAYFQNARSKTVSPSRSYVMDRANMRSLTASMHGTNGTNGSSEEDARGRGAADDKTAAQKLARRWSQYLQSGKFKLSMPVDTPLGGTPNLRNTANEADFWTSYHNYPSMAMVAPRLHKQLQDSALVISKGDLNYRKWCSDARWPHDTPFAEVLGPVKGTMNLLCLRTCKADVCVGIPSDRLKTLDSEDAEWRFNGKYAVVEFVAKSV